MPITNTRPQAADERKQLQAFADLIARTAKGLRGVAVPAQLGATIDEVLADWERTDREFAAVLKELKGQGWSMQSEHLRAVREKLVQHLDANLVEVKKRIGS